MGRGIRTRGGTSGKFGGRWFGRYLRLVVSRGRVGPGRGGFILSSVPGRESGARRRIVLGGFFRRFFRANGLLRRSRNDETVGRVGGGDINGATGALANETVGSAIHDGISEVLRERTFGKSARKRATDEAIAASDLE